MAKRSNNKKKVQAGRRENLFPRSKFTDLRALPISLRMGSFQAEILNWGFIKQEWWRNHLHIHTFYEICYAYGGQGIFRMLGDDYPVKKGDVFIAKPGEEHEIISSTKRPLGIYFWSYSLVSNKQKSRKSSKSEQGFNSSSLNRLLHDFAASTCYVSPRAPYMEETLQLLTEEIIRKEPGYVDLINGLVRKLIIDTARAALPMPMTGENPPIREHDPAKALVLQAIRYMRDNYGRELSIQDISAQVNVGERHLARLFKRHGKKSPLLELVSIRMEAAAQLILDRRLTIKEIANRCGYPDVRYFTTVFRKHLGRPPARYRETGGTQFS